MKIDQQDAVVMIQLKQRNADEGKTTQIERLPDFFRSQGSRLGLALISGQAGQVNDFYTNLALCMNLLNGFPFAFTKCSSPDLMALDDLIETRFERLNIEFATKTIRNRNMIRGVAGIDLIDDPHLALSEGKGRPLALHALEYFWSFRGRFADSLKALREQPLPLRGKLGAPIRQNLRAAIGGW